MSDLLGSRPAPLLLGPLIGLVVIGLAWTINQRIGVMGGYSTVLERTTGRIGELSWRAWFLFGVFGGALVFRLLSGASNLGDGYGWLTRTFSSGLVVGLILIGAGALIGFGAKTAGGCTSGNGLGGCSQGSVASFAATATFMATAIALSFLIRAVI
ncbi:MAG: YeeE/YedE thiosulfate transporter family protein [Solirubrobacterales bacterium]